MITPRPYQQEVIDKLRESYKNKKKHPLIVMPTGGGKACILGFIAENAAKKGNDTLIIAHRQELIAQLSLTLCNFGLEHNLITAKSTATNIKADQFKNFGRVFYNKDSKLHVGSVQTLASRVCKLSINPRLIIIDEQHHLKKGNQWGSIFEAYPNALGLGLTATPQRSDGVGLGVGSGGYNDDLILGAKMSWLIEQGYLAPYKVYTTAKQWDVSSVKTKRNGEYDEKGLEELIDKPSVTGDAIAHYKKLCSGMSGVCYCTSISHSKHVTQQFIENGIPAAHVDGTMSDAERKKVFTDYADGVIKIICNQALISEGTDLESLTQRQGVTLDVCIDLAPSKSLVVVMQRWGRVLRKKPNKTAIILDHSGNVLRHSLPCADREWSLEGNDKKKRESDEKDVNIRTCQQCFHIHEPAPMCPICGFVYPIQQRSIEEVSGELVELTEQDKAEIKRKQDEEKKQKKREQGQCQTLQDFLALAESRGYKQGWAHKIWAIRQNQKRGISH